MNADGSEVTMVSTPPTDAGNPCWSADGAKIVFERLITRMPDGGTNLFVIDAEGKNQRRLTASAAFDGHAALSPDGSKIVFQSNRDGNYELYVVDVH